MSACATFVRQHNIIGGSRARPQRHTRVRYAIFVSRPHRKCTRAAVYKKQVDECTLARFVLETRVFSYAFRSGVAIRREITWKRTKYAHWIQYFCDMYAECIKSNEMLNGQISNVHLRALFFLTFGAIDREKSGTYRYPTQLTNIRKKMITKKDDGIMLNARPWPWRGRWWIDVDEQQTKINKLFYQSKIKWFVFNNNCCFSCEKKRI